MLQNAWDNSASTAAMYVGVILLFYISGLFCLLIHSIKQRTDDVTCYDIYLELSDIVKFVISLLRAKSSKKEQNKLQQQSNDDTRTNLSSKTGEETVEGNKIVICKKPIYDVLIFPLSYILSCYYFCPFFYQTISMTLR